MLSMLQCTTPNVRVYTWNENRAPADIRAMLPPQDSATCIGENVTYVACVFIY